MSYSITHTHQFLGKKESPSWLEQNNIKGVFENEVEKLYHRLKTDASDEIESIILNHESLIPTISLCLKTDNYNTGTTVGNLIDLYGAEIHAFQFDENRNQKQLRFDLLVPPKPLAGSISNIRNANEETASWNISVTRALEYAGFYPEYSLNMSYRNGEIKIWDSSHNNPYRTQKISTDKKNPEKESVEKMLKNLPDVSKLQLDLDNKPATISFECSVTNPVKMKSLQYGLSKLPISIKKIEFNPSEDSVFVTVNAYKQFEKAYDRRGSPETVIREQNPSSYIITLTNALEKSGLVSEENNSESKERVSVFARPGELLVRKAATYTGHNTIK